MNRNAEGTNMSNWSLDIDAAISERACLARQNLLRLERPLLQGLEYTNNF